MAELSDGLLFAAVLVYGLAMLAFAGAAGRLARPSPAGRRCRASWSARAVRRSRGAADGPRRGPSRRAVLPAGSRSR